MSSILPDIFASWNQSVNILCRGRMQCDSLYELGPPPDSILNIPPPPVPPFMEEFVSALELQGLKFDEGSPAEGCSMCNWADSSGVGFVELAQKGPLIDDTWFLVIISSCVGATLLGIILAIAFLKYREGKLKPLSDVVLAKKEKALGLERCEAVLYPTTQLSPIDPRGGSRALWAGLKPLEGNHYTVDHCQPMEQKSPRIDLLMNSDNIYDYADYSSITYTPIGPNFGDVHQQQKNIAGRPPSFENIAYVPGGGEEPIAIEKLGPDGCVVTRAAYLLGGGHSTPIQNQGNPHLYEMVTPTKTSTAKRHHKSLERGALRQTPVISAPTSVHTMRLPALNSRYNGRYTLTSMGNGSHTLYPQNIDRKYSHVSLDRSGMTNTTLIHNSPMADNIYASPITSPVI